MREITALAGQRTLFPIAHICTELPMLIQPPERFLRVNLQLLMELLVSVPQFESY